MSPERAPESRLAERGALLLSLLRREKRGHLQRVALRGGGRILAFAVAGLALLLVIAALRPGLPLVLGRVLGIAAWAGLAWLVWRYWIRPLRAVPNLAVFARLVEERRDFRDLLRAGLEFSQRGAPEGESADLVGATVDRAYEEASRLRLVQLFQFPHARRDGAIAAAAVVVVAALAALVPQAPGRVLQGLALRWPTPAEIQYGGLEVVSGDLMVLSGESAEVVVRENGPQAPEMVLRFNDTGDLWKSRALTPMTSTSPREYAFRFEDVRSDLTYRFESGRRRTQEHRIAVVQRPIVGGLKLRLVPPSYTGRRPAELEEGRGDAVALRGTRVEIEIQSSSTLVSALVVPDPADAGAAVTLQGPLTMQTEGRAARAGFALRGDLRYHFALVDSLGHTNADPVTYQLSTVEDREPYVEVRVPGQDADIPPSLQVPIQVYAADDYGIARMTLLYQVEKAAHEGVSELDGVETGAPAPGGRSPGAGGRADAGRSTADAGDPARWSRRVLPLRGEGSTDPEGQPLPPGTPSEVLHSFTWSVADAGLFPGDAVAYCIEVVDNDAVTGPKSVRSQVYRLRLQTLSELYAKIQENDDTRMGQLDDAIEKSRQLKEKYERLSRELKKNPEMDWKKEKEVEGALEKQKQIAEQVQKIAEDLEKSVTQMQDQQLVSQEITQKLDEIRKLLDQVEDDTMREYMERLQEAMKQISPEEIQRAMEQMNMSQEEFLKRLERTKSLLEQLRREQQLDAMIERLAELLRQQERVGKDTQQLDEQKSGDKNSNPQSRDAQREQPKDPQSGEPKGAEQPEQLAQEQKELGDKTSELQKELDELAKEAKEAGQQNLDEANQQMQQENPSAEMQDASQQLQSGKPQQAQPHQQKAESTLRSLYQQLMDAQQQMSMQAQAEAAEALQKAARQALDVSFRQESVAKQPGGAARGDNSDAAVQQQGLLAATGKVVGDLDALAQKTAAAPPQVAQLLGQAMAHMREGVRSYERGNTAGGRSQGEEAYGYLNRAVVELNRALSSAASCNKPGGGTGTPQQQMEQLMGEQQKLNDATRQLQQSIPNPQNLSPEERAQMARLLGQQRSIQSQLQDIEAKARAQKQLLGRLDKMQQEMHEVVEDFSSEALDEETVRVQERIVSRMLDAQRSLHKRDFNEERESRTAAEIFSKGGRMPEQSDRAKKLRRDIERALREGTPEEYEDLVREYFRAIAETPGTTQEPVP